MCRSLAQRVWLAESEAQKLDTSGWHEPLRLDTSTLVNPLTGLEQESKRDRLATKPNKTTTRPGSQGSMGTCAVIPLAIALRLQ